MQASEKKLRVVFMGTPEFALPSLQSLLDTENVVAVVTNPDRRSGRGRRVHPSPVKSLALKADVPVLTPGRLKSESVQEELKRARADLFVVAAYGRILPKAILNIPPSGCINVHASLLPAYRGAAPIQWAIINGETRTGITIMEMDEGMDTGPILMQEGMEIRQEDTAGSLSTRLADLGGKVLKEALVRLKRGKLEKRPQPDGQASSAPMLSKSQGRIHWNRPAEQVFNFIRGTDPWPGAHTILNEQPLKVFHPAVRRETGPAGRVLGITGDALVVTCATGAVALGELQLPGRKRMTARALCAGTPIPPGTVLE
jgi:methionyl-tRNA formyltransferase